MIGIQAHPTPLIPDPNGVGKEVSYFKQTRKNIRERGIRVGRGLRASYGVDGTLIEVEKQAVAESGAGASNIKRLQLFAQGTNYYTTYQEGLDGNFNIQGPNVAVPFFYRTSTYDLGGIPSGYTAGLKFKVVSGQVRLIGSSDADYIPKLLFPSYALGQIIYAGEVEAGTDVYATPPSTNRVTWIDLTARTWITLPMDFSVCTLVAGQPVTKAALIDGGPIH